MNGRTRYFVVASTLVMTVGVGAGVVAYYVGAQPAAAGGIDDLRLVPREAALVAYANVRDVMGSEVGRRTSAAAPNEERRRELEERTGINVQTDIDRVVAFVDAPAGTVPPAPLLLVRGRFNEAKVETLLRDHGAELQEYKAKRLIVMTPPDRGRPVPTEPLAVTFIEPGLMAAGDARMVRGVIDRQKGGENITANDRLMTLVAPLDGSTLWAAGRVDALRQGPVGHLPAGLADQLLGINWFAVNGRLTTTVDGQLRVEARDEQTATALRDMVRGFLSLAKLQATADPRVQAAVQSFSLGGIGTQVAFSFSFDPEALSALRVPPAVR